MKEYWITWKIKKGKEVNYKTTRSKSNRVPQVGQTVCQGEEKRLVIDIEEVKEVKQ